MRFAGATVIVNCSASDEVVGKDSYRRELICGQSARLICGYVYANAGEGGVYPGSGIWRPQYHCGERNSPGRVRTVCSETVMADMDLSA